MTVLLRPPKITNPYSYPTLDRQTQENGIRHYIDPTGIPLPSVTTILSATSDKTHLKLWEARVGAAKAERARNEGTALGSLVHEHLECFMEDRPRPGGNNLVRQMAERMANKIIEEAIPDIDEVWGIEATLYYPGLFAGTTDLVGVFKGRPAIMDFKNAKNMRKRDQINDYMDQLAAYALAHDHLYGTSIDYGAIFMVARDLSYKTYEIQGEEFAKHKASFASRLEYYMANPSI